MQSQFKCAIKSKNFLSSTEKEKLISVLGEIETLVNNRETFRFDFGTTFPTYVIFDKRLNDEIVIWGELQPLDEVITIDSLTDLVLDAVNIYVGDYIDWEEVYGEKTDDIGWITTQSYYEELIE